MQELAMQVRAVRDAMRLKHPKIYKCSLCDQRYAVLNSTFHISQSYRMHFCRDCTDIIQNLIRKVKKGMVLK